MPTTDLTGSLAFYMTQLPLAISWYVFGWSWSYHFARNLFEGPADVVHGHQESAGSSASRSHLNNGTQQATAGIGDDPLQFGGDDPQQHRKYKNRRPFWPESNLASHPSESDHRYQRRLNKFFVPGEGIRREVITAEICPQLGKDVMVTPGMNGVRSPCFDGIFSAAAHSHRCFHQCKR